MIKSLFVPLQRLREEVRQLKQSVEAVTNASPEKLVEQILACASRPLTEFNKYEVLEMLETLHNKAADRNHDRKNYYRLVHQSAREKVELSKDHFKDLVMRLLGDKDHERVLDIVSKVEKKSNRKKPQANDNRGAGVARPSRLFSLRCYFCHRRGHIKADCPDLKSKQRKTDPKSDK